MDDHTLITHLDAMETRLTTAIGEVRKDVASVAVAQAAMEPRVESVERSVKRIWGSAGSAFLTMLGTFTAHVWGSHGR